MYDRFERQIDYLRISVTDRCDLRCVYCMPAEGIACKPRDAILSYARIEAVAREAVALGVTKIRLTGGEPLVRHNIEELVGRLARIGGLRELAMTTNGTRLAAMAGVLKARGLGRVNVSLDTLDPERYRAVTRGGDLGQVLRGIEAAAAAGLTPVKINMVIIEDTGVDEVERMRRFCDARGMRLQTIMHFSLYDRRDLRARFLAERPPSCAQCNRLRLTSDGFLKPCLFSEDEIAVDFTDMRGSIRAAVAAKPESGSRCRNREMCAIGG
ncbi:MAG: radical SAM protein [Lentisphaerae bacterium]|nr:radical SAM protein [Lentisphaerota bacterium]